MKMEVGHRNGRRRKVAVLVADRHDGVRAGLARLLAAYVDIEVVGAACDGREAVDAVIERSPDVIVMDLSMPDLDGVEATRRIRAAAPGVRIVILAASADRRGLRDAREAGASACLLKDAEPAALVAVVRAAADSGIAPAALVGL